MSWYGINYEVELNDPYQPFGEELMEMFNPTNPYTFSEEEDDDKPCTYEHVAHMCVTKNV